MFALSVGHTYRPNIYTEKHTDKQSKFKRLEKDSQETNSQAQVAGEILRKAKYIRTYSYKQTPSSILINKTKIEFGELTDWTIAKEDEKYMQLQLI